MITPTPREAADVERMAGVIREAVHQNGTLKDYLGSATTRAVAHAALDHARTASGDDRGQELAERIVKAIGDPGAVIGNRDWGSDERLIDWQTRAVLSVLPPLIAPAETEAGDEPGGQYGPEPTPVQGAWTITGPELLRTARDRVGTVLPDRLAGPLRQVLDNLDYYRGELAGSWHDAGDALARGIVTSPERLVPRLATPTAPEGEAVTTAEVGAWDRERFGNRGVVRIALKLAEETGEVAGAVVKRDEGAVRPAKGLVTHEQWTAHLFDEVGDVGIALHALCAREGTTLDEVVTRRFRDDVALRTGQEAPAMGEQCPTCTSHRPELHPAVQKGGEVQLCPDPFHATVTPENTPERVAALSGDLWTVYPEHQGWWTPALASPQGAGGGHAGIDGERPLREQTAGKLGLTRGTRSDGDAAHWTPGGEQP